ncbi:GAF domain-containing protein [Candidatus Azambacteria bacterium]|nr:GAF domain-containing protein [Candidatus Azambacteria bacterium]
MFYFIATSLVNAFIAGLLGFLVISKNWRDLANKLFFGLSISVVFWALNYWQWLSSQNANSALVFSRLFSVGALFIPIFYFHWVLIFSGTNKQYKTFLKVLYFIAFVFLSLSFSKLFIEGVGQKLFFPFWPTPGILYNIYLIVIYFGLTIYSLFILWRSYIRSNDSHQKAIIKYIILGSFIGFSGGATNFFLWYDIPILPYGNILVSFYPLALALASFRHGLFNIKVIATELLTLTVWIAVLVELILAETWEKRLLEAGLLAFVVVSGIFIIRSVLKEVEQKDKFKDLSERLESANAQLKQKTLYLTTLQGFTHDIGRTLDFKEITQKIVDGISEKFGYLAGLLLLVSEDGKMIFPVTITENTITKIALKILPKQMHEYAGDFEHDDTLSIRAVKDNAIQQSNAIADFLSPPISETLCVTIQKATGLKSGVAIPIRSEGKAIGVLDIFLDRPKEEIGGDELEVMKTLANQIGIVLKNASLFEQVKEANEKLKELDDLKTDFISIASHQLRTPLTAIKGYTSMIMEGSYGEVSDKVRVTIGKVFQSAQRLIYIVNDLLDISRIEQGRFTIALEPIKVANVLKDVVEELQQNAKSKNLSLELAVAPENMEVTASADFNKIRQVFLNVIDNAIKYTNEGYVRVGVEKRANDVLMSVKDSGIGISEASMKNLFQKFSRAKGVTKLHTDGSGLGLFIVKKIMEAHGGTVWAESEGEGKGSQFYVSIPLQKE